MKEYCLCCEEEITKNTKVEGEEICELCLIDVELTDEDIAEFERSLAELDLDFELFED